MGASLTSGVKRAASGAIRRIGQHGLRAMLEPELQEIIASRDRPQDSPKRGQRDGELLRPAGHSATVLRVDRVQGAANLQQRGYVGEDVHGKEVMANIAKVITIIGSSPESFAKAADAAVQEAAKTVA